MKDQEKLIEDLLLQLAEMETDRNYWKQKHEAKEHEFQVTEYVFSKT